MYGGVDFFGFDFVVIGGIFLDFFLVVFVI